MSASSSSSSGGIGVVGLLGVVFITLKLLGKIDWSWWWVLAPFWGALLFVLVLILVVLGIAVVGEMKPKRGER